MGNIDAFLTMGGYAEYVWPAFVLTLLVLSGVAWASLRALRAHERALEQINLACDGPSRRPDP